LALLETLESPTAVLTSFVLKIKIEALMQLHRASEAAELLTELERNGADDPELPIIRVQLLVATDKLAEAYKEAELLLVEHPEHPTLMRVKALALTKLGRPGPAATIWQSIIKLDPRDIPARLWYAVCLYGLGNHKDAAVRLDALIPILEKDAHNQVLLADALTYYGSSLFLLKQEDKALVALQRAVQLKPTHLGLKTLAACWMRLENYSEALRWTERALSANSSDPQLKRMKEELVSAIREQQMSSTDDDGATDSVRESTPDEIRRSQQLLSAAFQQHLAGANAHAIETVDDALDLFPQFPEAWDLRARILKSMGRLDEAIESAGIARRLKTN
jgi:tetratricopeptide (TPR) repeat protein